jgi:ABC-type transport system substrate-binding protein
MTEGYWSKIARQELSRRRALAATAGGAVGAALLAACSGGSSSSNGSSAGQGAGGSLVTTPADTTQKAKRGGVMKDRIHGDVATFDPFTPDNTLNAVVGMTDSSLVQFKPGYMKPTQNEVGPDIAESWEFAPDGLSIILKIRQGVKFHNKAPVNGRALDIDDVIFSWKRFEAKSSSRAGVANSVSPAAPIISITASDARTVVMKLKEPIIHALGLFTSNATGGTVILPKETDSSFDVRGDTIGTGPFYLSEYKPSQGFTFKRNPDYWDKDSALVDTVEKPIITEYAATLAQFKAGNIYTFGSYTSGPQITADDVLPTKRDEPRILVYKGPLSSAGIIGNRVGFGWLPEGKSPFLDERVRQAISLSWDRDLYLETFYNVKKFADQGLPLETRWHTSLVASTPDGWLDPKSKDFGPNAKYLGYQPGDEKLDSQKVHERNLADAKKMLAAAGYATGFTTTSSYVTTSELSLTPKHAAAVDGFMRDLGITINQHPIDYTKEYIPSYRDGHGQYEGWTYTSTAGAPTGGESIIALANEFWSKGGSASYVGMSLSGKNDQSGDPQLDALFEKGRLERDAEKRRQIVYEIQRSLAKSLYSIRTPGMATAFLVAWPSVANYSLWGDGRQNYQLWVDDTKPPFKSA